MKITYLQQKRTIRFRRWSRKNYAVFAGLHQNISIGKVDSSISDKALLKNNLTTIISNLFTKNVEDEVVEDSDDENLFLTDILKNQIAVTYSADIPVGCNKYYSFKVGMKSIFVPTFLF